MEIGTFRRFIHNCRIAIKQPPYTNGFLNQVELDDHFKKHRSKFTFANAAEYQIAADNFCGGKIDKNTVVCKRKRDGARILYNKSSNELGFVDGNGFITSYFKPTKKGLEYFQRACL